MKLRGHLSILMWIKVSTLYKRNQNTFTDSELKKFFLQHLSKKYVLKFVGKVKVMKAQAGFITHDS